MVIRLLHDCIVEIVEIQLSLKRNLMICIQKVECENRFGTKK